MFNTIKDKMLNGLRDLRSVYFRNDVTEEESWFFSDFWLWLKMGDPVRVCTDAHKSPVICIG